MPESDLWTRVKKSRIAQAIILFVVACWAILQVLDILQQAMDFPGWVRPAAFVLLLIGLLMILSTAWVQSHPQRSVRAAAGEVPGGWELAPRALVGDLVAGEVPHLTWARSILGGIFALSLLFGLAALVTVFHDEFISTGPSIGPAVVGADLAPAGIAVVPFDVTGPDLDLWRDGMVDVLSTNLDGMGGYRTIDARTVLARWREQVEGSETPDLRTSLQVAASTGARYGLVGGLVGSASGVRISADIYDLSSGREIAQSWVEGPRSEILDLVEELSIDLTRKLLERPGDEIIQVPRAASLTTRSLPALRAYLEGEAAFRKTDFSDAAAAFERAVALDSTFALAWYRLGDSYGWLQSLSSEQGAEASARAAALSDQLPARERVLVRADQGLVEGDYRVVEPLRKAVRTYPDDPEAWYLLGDFYLHYGVGMGVATLAEAREAFSRANELDPTFLPYQLHQIEIAILMGDTAAVEGQMAHYQKVSPGEMPAYLRLIHDLFLTGSRQREEALAALDTMDAQTVMGAGQGSKDLLQDQAWVEQVSRKAYEITGSESWLSHLVRSYIERGQIGNAIALLEDPTDPPALRYEYAALLQELGAVDGEALAEVLNDSPVCTADRGPPPLPCIVYEGLVAARAGDRPRWRRSLDRARLAAADLSGGDAGEAVEGKEMESGALAVEGFWALYQEQDSTGAAHLLEEATNYSLGPISLLLRWRLLGLTERGQPGDAIRALDRFEGLLWGYGRVRAGRIFERMGREDDAARAYGDALATFRDGDPDNPLLVEAQRSLDRLGR